MKSIRSRMATLVCAVVMAAGLSACGVDITSVGLPAAEVLGKGSTLQMEVNYGTTGQAGADALAKAADKLDLVWTSSDETVATVDEAGVVTAVGPGEAEITVSAADGTLSSACLVTVVVPAQGITVPDKLDLVLNGQNTARLNAAATPEDATGVTLEYASADEDVATVDGTGLVTAVGNGETDITVTLTQSFPVATGESATPESALTPGEYTATVHVTVTTAVESITFDKTAGVLTVGGTHQIKAAVAPETAAGQALTWTSSNEAVATVDGSGKVTAKAVGSATICASAGDVRAEYALTVQNLTCSYCGATGHTSANCPVKAAAQQQAAAQAAQQQAAAQAAPQQAPQQQAAQSSGSSDNTSTPSAPSAPDPAPAPDSAPSGGDSGSSGGSDSFGQGQGGSLGGTVITGDGNGDGAGEVPDL